MGVDATGSGDESVAVDDHGARTDDDIDIRRGVGVACAADAADAPLADADASDTHTVNGIEDHDVCDDEVA